MRFSGSSLLAFTTGVGVLCAASAQAEEANKTAAINWFMIQDATPRPTKVAPPRSFGLTEVMIDVPEKGTRGHRPIHTKALEPSDEELRLKADVRRQVKHFWHPGVGAPSPVVVSFKLLRDGKIVDLKLLKSCGLTTCDQAALNAVARSAPFQYPPRIPTTVCFTFDDRLNGGLQSALSAVQIVD